MVVDDDVGDDADDAIDRHRELPIFCRRVVVVVDVFFFFFDCFVVVREDDDDDDVSHKNIDRATPGPLTLPPRLGVFIVVIIVVVFVVIGIISRMDISRVNVEDIFDEPLQKFWVDVFEKRAAGFKNQHIRPYRRFYFWNHPKSYRRNEWF